jgi:hypothetical protein
MAATASAGMAATIRDEDRADNGGNGGAAAAAGFLDDDTNFGGNSASLIIPIKSSASAAEKGLFVEIFPEEMGETPPSTLAQVLRDEMSDLGVWCDASLLYMQEKHARESLALLKEACELSQKEQEQEEGGNDTRVRILASTGIAHLASQQHHHQGGKSSTAAGESPFFVVACDSHVTNQVELRAPFFLLFSRRCIGSTKDRDLR